MTTNIKASHILVSTEAEAKDLKSVIDAGTDFAEVARTKSSCPSKVNGGELGLFGRGAMVKPFEDAAFELEVGKISEPVQTQFGWHLIHRTA